MRKRSRRHSADEVLPKLPSEEEGYGSSEHTTRVGQVEEANVDAVPELVGREYGARLTAQDREGTRQAGVERERERETESGRCRILREVSGACAGLSPIALPCIRAQRDCRQEGRLRSRDPCEQRCFSLGGNG